MQFILAILAILLYAAIYAVGFIIVGIVELVKYIKNRKEESRKAAEQKAKSITLDIPAQKESQSDNIRASTTKSESAIIESTELPSEDSDSQNTTPITSSDPIELYSNIETKNTADDYTECTTTEPNNSVIEEVVTSIESIEATKDSATLIGEVIMSLQEHLKNEELHGNDKRTECDTADSEDCKKILGSLIEALKQYTQDASSEDTPSNENHIELIDLVSSIKSNAELKRDGLISILHSLSATKKEVSHIINTETTSEALIEDQHIIDTPTTTPRSNQLVKNESNSHTKSQNESDSKSEESMTELAIFNNVIYHVKMLGHEDPRFKLITIKAYEIISQFGDSPNFFAEILCKTDGDTDFAMEVIRFIVIHKSNGISDNELIKKIRQRYINNRTSNTSLSSNVFNAKPKSETTPLYIEVEKSPGSNKLAAKSKIAHKHKAIQYANIIGGKLVDGYVNSDESSFHQFIKKHCQRIADTGDCSITTEEFEPYKNIIVTYKKDKKKQKSPRSIATNTITPKHEAGDSKANIVLRILDKLTSSRLPRYEVPSVPSTGSIIQREYKKTNPFDIYNDLVSSEYNPEALNDKRFAILYQLILFISECVSNGMSEEETLSAISSLRVVNKRDLYILRDREIRFKGLSKAERELVLDSELCNNRDMTNLYIDLILGYHKQANKNISLNDYIIGVLIKNYKESNAAWRLLKYINLKNNKRSNNYIIDNRWAILESYFIIDSDHGIKDINDNYYSLHDCFAKLKYEYEHYIDMTHYNFNRDNITTDMLNESTLKQYLPKRFDSKGRLCSIAMASPLEANLFKSFDKREVGDNIYVLFPLTSLTTKDLYSLLLTVVKQKRKHL